MPDGTKLAEFVAWCQKHVTGDEKGDAHAVLDAAVLTAYGFNPKRDLLAQLLALIRTSGVITSRRRAWKR